MVFNQTQPISQPGEVSLVERRQELDRLHQLLQERDRGKFVASVGPSGIGKTEFILQYVQQHYENYPGGICWLSATPILPVVAEILQFARFRMRLSVPHQEDGKLLSLSQQVEWCWRHWNPSTGKVLIIVDEVHDLNRCRQFLPTADRFYVLIATQIDTLDGQFVPIYLDRLCDEEARRTLLERAGLERVPPALGSASDLDDLCEELGYFPLALNLAGRYWSQQPELPIRELIGRLHARQLLNGVRGVRVRILDCQNVEVRTTFELIWETLTPLAQQISQALSLFAPTPIAWSWVKVISETLNWSAEEVEAVKKQLDVTGIMDAQDDRGYYYTIHPLIRKCLQAKFDTLRSDRAIALQQVVAKTIAASARDIPQSANPADVAPFELTVPHWVEVAENLTPVLDPSDLTWPFVGLARFYAGQGLYEIAQPWGERCIEAVTNQLGPEHIDITTSYNNLAYLYKSQGRYQEAEPLYVKALELRKRILGEKHADVATSYNNLASSYYAQGRLREAEPLYARALMLRKRVLGEEHADVATSYNNLASLYYAQGRLREAKRLYEQAWELSRDTLGANHPKTQLFRKNLKIFQSQSQFWGIWLEKVGLLSLAIALAWAVFSIVW
ncbi:MAG: tetratricopeptide repeat protein [Cyanobacteriota bacterium]|nr:tetratricopeptide repeat protein [Cyanobacteriota bacterium]